MIEKLAKIKIGIYDFSVVEVHGPIIVNGVDCKGSVDFLDLEIKLLKNLNPQIKLQTLFHEIQHAIQWYFEIVYTDWKEEDVTDFNATGWLQVFKDNPDLTMMLN